MSREPWEVERVYGLGCRIQGFSLRQVIESIHGNGLLEPIYRPSRFFSKCISLALGLFIEKNPNGGISTRSPHKNEPQNM